MRAPEAVAPASPENVYTISLMMIAQKLREDNYCRDVSCNSLSR